MRILEFSAFLLLLSLQQFPALAAFTEFGCGDFTFGGFCCFEFESLFAIGAVFSEYFAE